MKLPALKPILAKLRLRTALAIAGGRRGMVADFGGTGFIAHRRMSPAEVRFVLEQALIGNLDAQWDLFALMEDTWPRLAKNLAELRRAAARATYTVQPYARKGEKPTASANEKAAFVEDALKQWWPKPGTFELGFEDTLFHALDAYGKGISALEIHWQRTPAGLVPRAAHVLASRLYAWDETGAELGLRTAAGRGWQPFEPDHFLVGIWQARTGAPGATALLRALAPYWAGITYGWEWLLNNAQIFGTPYRWATYDRSDPNLAPLLRDLLAAMGQSGYAAFPDGTKLEFKEVSQNVTGNPQVVVQDLANQACDLLILGQELSGKAQAAGLGGGAADLQGSVRADRLADVTQWCADLLSYQLVPALLRANWGDTEEPPLIVPGEAEETDSKKLAERDQILLNAGVAMPRKWFYERHKIPEPVDGEEVIGGKPASADKTDPSDQSDPSDRPDQPDPKPPIAAKDTTAAPASATDALYDARAMTLLTAAQCDALSPLLNALRAYEDGIIDLPRLNEVITERAPAILADPALAAAWEKVIAPPAAEGAAELGNAKIPLGGLGAPITASRHGWHDLRDELGRFAPLDGGPNESRREPDPKLNQRLGDQAVEIALRRRADVKNAMYRRELGAVDFEWGRPGHRQPDASGKTHTDGYGISHIHDKHGEKALRAMPGVVAHGQIGKHETDPDKRHILHDGWKAIVKKTGKGQSYVVTSFDPDEGRNYRRA